MSNSRRRRFIPSFDSLESRTVPAGNITASVVGGTLYFTGDDEANHISITGIGNGGVRIESGSDATTINGEEGPLVFWNVTKGIAGYLFGGDDQLTISNVSLKREIGLNLGDGDDYLLLQNVHVKKPSTIKGGDGDDIINIIGSSFRKELAVYGNAGEDQVGIINTKIGKHSRIDGGIDNDTFTARGNKWGHNVKLENFQFKSSQIQPNAVADTAVVEEGSFIDIDVAANDQSLLGQLDLSSIVIVNQPTHGTVTVNDDGTVTYFHDGSETTSDSFTYTISNTNGNTSQPATVSLTINPTNDPPVALNDTANVAEGGTVNINVAANDSDADGTLNLGSIIIVQQPVNGTATVNNNGTVTYTHNGSETTSDTFTYTIKDNLGATSNTATVNITVSPVNDAPIAVDDNATVDEGGQVNIPVASNDSDPENSIDLTSIVIVLQPAHGTVTVNNDGTVTYTHDGTNTTSDTFTYTIKDTQGATSNVATVNITITAVNNPPVANDDSASVGKGVATVIDLAANDTDDNGLALTSIVIVQQPQHGSLVVNNDGTVTYTHDGSDTTTDSFTYTINDIDGLTSNTATVTLTISQPPVAVDDNASVDEGAAVNIDLAANDTDADGTLDLTSIVITQQPAHGTVTVNNDGTVTYTHDGSETTADSFSYTIRDNDGVTSNEATVSITINPVNDDPIANDDNISLVTGDTVNIPVAANDNDPENELDLTSIEITEQPANGTVTVNNDGTVTYTHDGSATTSDSFKYTIKDLSGAVSNEATVTISIGTAPVANDDDAAVNEGSSVVIDLAANDTDADGTLNLNSIVITQQPAHGSIIIHDDGTVTYTHDGSETTSDSFQYTIKDNIGLTSNVATVTIAINPVNDAPIAEDDAATVDEGGSVLIDLAANDSDADSSLDLTSIVIVQQPAHGSLQMNGDGTVTYLHDGSNTTSDSFTYTIADVEGAVSNIATVTISINPINTPPVAVDDSATVDEGDSVIINLADNDSDSDGTLNLASIVIVNQPAHGTITIHDDGTVTYTHDGSETTSDSFTYSILDNEGAVSNTATVTITINPVNDAPIAVDDDANVVSGGSVIIPLAANDNDPEGQLDLTSIVITQQPANGTLTINGDGTITYTHDGSATTSDSFKYTINDQDGVTSNEALVNIAITAGNQPPVAVNDFFSILVFEVKVFNLISNDTDDGVINPASIVIVNPPSHGSIIVNANGTVTYMHNGSASPTDSFTYTIEDTLGLVSNIATVTINIT